MRGFFITGTDTNVGKTVLSALLVAALDGTYWKPIQTGAVEGTDRESVRRMAEVSDDHLAPENYIFDPPVSPHLAARKARVKISLNTIQYPKMTPNPRWIVEGAGGVMVPLSPHLLMLDLMRHLGLPAIIATRTTLGTINHTMLTVAAIRGAEVNLQGIVTIGDENQDNRRAMEYYGNTKVIGHIPKLEQIDRVALLSVFAKYFDFSAFDLSQRWQSKPHLN